MCFLCDPANRFLTSIVVTWNDVKGRTPRPFSRPVGIILQKRQRRRLPSGGCFSVRLSPPLSSGQPSCTSCRTTWERWAGDFHQKRSVFLFYFLQKAFVMRVSQKQEPWWDIVVSARGLHFGVASFTPNFHLCFGLSQSVCPPFCSVLFIFQSNGGASVLRKMFLNKFQMEELNKLSAPPVVYPYDFPPGLGRGREKFPAIVWTTQSCSPHLNELSFSSRMSHSRCTNSQTSMSRALLPIGQGRAQHLRDT